MATDATGTPTSLGIPKFNVNADAPSGLGGNAQMDSIDALIKNLGISGLVANDVPVYDTVTGKFIKATGTPSSTTYLRGDGSWATVSAGALVIIDDYTVTGSVLASYDTNTRLGGNIPQTYKDLLLVVRGKSDQGSGPQNLLGRINNVNTTNYYWQDSYASSTAVTSVDAVSQQEIRLGYMPRSSVFGVAHAEIYIPNYTQTPDSVIVDSDYFYINDNSSGALRRGHAGGLYAASVAVTRFSLLLSTGNFAIGTRFTLYGRG